jgi:hypothetical protein
MSSMHLFLAFLNSLGIFFVGFLFTIFRTRLFTSFSIIIIVIIENFTSTCLYWGLQAFLWAYNFWIFIFIVSSSIFKTLLIYFYKLGYYSSIISSSIMVSLKLIAMFHFQLLVCSHFDLIIPFSTRLYYQWRMEKPKQMCVLPKHIVLVFLLLTWINYLKAIKYKSKHLQGQNNSLYSPFFIMKKNENVKYKCNAMQKKLYQL